VSAYVDQHRDRFGVEPICQTLDVSASAYYQRKSGERSARAVEEERLTVRIHEVHEANYEAYGYRRVHAQLVREDETAGRDQVARVMRSAGVQGAKRRGKPWRTTIADPRAQRPADLVQRDFTADRPDAPWVCDFTYLRCWEGRAFFAFVSRRVQPDDRWLAVRQSHAHRSRARRAEDGARPAPAGRGRRAGSPLRRRLSQYTSGDYQQELTDHTVLASIGSVGDCYDNARRIVRRFV